MFGSEELKSGTMRKKYIVVLLGLLSLFGCYKPAPLKVIKKIVIPPPPIPGNVKLPVFTSHQKLTLVDARTLRKIKVGMTLSKIFEIIGMPENETVSKIHILQWRGTDGSILTVGTESIRLEEKVIFVKILNPKEHSN